MPHRCTRCGRAVDDAFAAENDGLCTRRCGGRLEPVPAPDLPDLDGLDPSPLPYPVALTAGRLGAGLRGAADTCRAVFLLKDCFEGVVKYLGSVLLVEYLRGPARTPDRDARLLEGLVRPTLGVWVNVVLGDVGRWLAGGPDPGGAAAALFARPAPRAGGKPSETDLFADCRGFVEYRNDVLGHGATRPDAAYAADLARWLPTLRRLLDGAAGLAGWRLCLVADVDRCQVWVGDRPGPATEPGNFSRALVGKFVLRGPGGDLRPLDPFVCYVPVPDRERRLHFYDSVYRYTAARRELALLEYDEGFKRVSPDPVPALEAAFTAELLAAAFGRHRGKMAVIEGRVANFGELIETHAGIVGRGFTIDRVKQFVAGNDRGLLVITGEPGRGKTALTAHLVGEVFGHHAPPPVHFFYRRTAGITDPDVCVRSLYHALLEAHGLTESDESKRQADPEERARKLDDLLARHVGPKLLPSRPQLIFVDALDEADPTPTGRTAFHRLPADLPAGVYVVATTRPVADRSALARRPHLHWLDLDSPDFEQDHLRDGREYVERELVGTDLPGEARAALAAAGAGNFLVLKLLCARVRDGLTADGVRDLLRRLATDGAADRLGFVYEEFWARLTARLPLEELRLVADAAGVLAWAKAPLTAELLCRVLGRPAAEVERAVRRLAEYLTAARYEEGGAEETFYRVYHESFADFLRAKLSADRDRLAGALADFCPRWAELPDGYARTYAVRFGPAHLQDLSRWDGLERLLTDWRFLEAKAEAGFVFELAADLEAATDALPPAGARAGLVQLVRAAILPEIRFVAEHPETLFQCAWNAGWWHDGPSGLLSGWLGAWRAAREPGGRPRPWLRSVRPPVTPLTTAHATAISFPDGAGPRCVAFSPDGTRVAVGTVEGAVRVWDVRHRRECRRYSGPTAKVDAVAFSPDGTRLAAGYLEGTLCVWDAATGDELWRFLLEDDLAAMREHGFDPDEPRPRGCVVNQGVYDLCLSGDTLYALFGHEASKHVILRAHNLVDGRGWLSWDAGPILAGAVSPAAGLFAVSCPFFARPPGSSRPGILARILRTDSAILLRGLGYGTEVERDLVHRGEIAASLRFSPDGSRLASGGSDGAVRLWDVTAGRELWCSADHGLGRKAVAVAADGTVAAVANRGEIWLRDGPDGAERARLSGHAGGVWGLAFSPDGSALASAGRDDLVRLWDLRSLARPARAVGRLHRLWDWVKRWVLRSPARPGRSAPDQAGHFPAVAVSPDGTRVATGSYFGQVWVWSVADGLPVVTTRGHTGWVSDLQFSPDSSLLVSASNDATARVWDARSGKELARSGEPEDKGLTGNVRLDTLASFAPSRPEVTAVRFAPDGRRVAYTDDGTVLWDWRRGRRVALSEPCVPAADLRFLPTGEVEAVHDGRQYRWNPATGAAVGEAVPAGGAPAAVPTGRWSWVEEGQGIMIRSPEGAVIARCPVAVRPGPPPHGDRIWAGSVRNRLCIYVLEGVDEPSDSLGGSGRGGGVRS